LKRANQMRLDKDSDDTDYDMLEPDNDDILSLHKSVRKLEMYL
jgi:hypothetical protein